MTLSRGTRLGPYEVLSLLGAGGMGEVYRARDPRLGREVALKVLPATHSNDPDRLRRFEREARAAGALDHPNILAVHDVGIHETTAYVVSELLEGETLRERLRYGALTSAKAVECGVQIARGLAAAHAKAIVHRDLKPENLFLTKDGRIKILDFGLAKLTQTEGRAADDEKFPTLTEETTPGRVLGTPGYMSPEQVTGRSVDHRSDVFSLGAVLYEMLTSRQPFKRDTDAETMYAILKEDPPAISGIDRGFSPSLPRVVQRCLEKQPADRFQSTHDVALALDAVAGPPDQPSPPADGVARPARSRLSIPLALVAALAIGLLAGWALSKADAPQAQRFKQLTFRRGPISNARFTADGNTIVYSASWAGAPAEVFAGRPESPESRPLGLSGARIASLSTSGEMALLLQGKSASPMLARAPLAGGAPREVLDDVIDADWSPDGGSLVIMRVVNARNRIEFPVGKVLHETPYGGIGDIRMSPKGELVAFVEGGGRSKAVAIADRSGKKATLSGGWVGLNSLAWSPTGEEIWFTTREADGSSALRAVALSGRDRLVARMAGVMVLQDIARDGRVLLTRETTRSETRGLLSGDAAERDLSWLDGSEAEDLSVDGRVVLFNERAVGGGPGGAVYLLMAGSSAAVRLGEGRGLALSPDGNWVLALTAATPARLVLLPAGAGEVRPIEMHGLRADSGEAEPACQWLADGRRILFWGTEPGRTWRYYIMDIAGGRPRPVTPESSYAWDGSRPLSPDGQFVFTLQKEGPEAPSKTLAYLHSTEGGRERRLAAMDGEWRVRWSGDGRSLFASPVGQRPAKVYRFDLGSERRELWKEISPPDPVGLGLDIKVLPTPDGRFYVYSYRRTLSELYLVEGWR